MKANLINLSDLGVLNLYSFQERCFTYVVRPPTTRLALVCCERCFHLFFVFIIRTSTIVKVHQISNKDKDINIKSYCFLLQN